MPPTSKKLKRQFGLGLFVCPSIYPNPPSPAPHPPKKKFFLDLDSFKKIYYSSPPPPHPSPIASPQNCFFFILNLDSVLKHSLTQAPQPHPHPHPNQFFFYYFRFGFLVNSNSLTLAPYPHPPPSKEFGFFVKKSLTLVPSPYPTSQIKKFFFFL